MRQALKKLFTVCAALSLLACVLITALCSDIVNPGRVGTLSSDVLKGQTFFISFFVVLYLVVSLVRTRAELEFFVAPHRLLGGLDQVGVAPPLPLALRAGQ